MVDRGERLRPQSHTCERSVLVSKVGWLITLAFRGHLLAPGAGGVSRGIYARACATWSAWELGAGLVHAFGVGTYWTGRGCGDDLDHDAAASAAVA
jgi:hypothetical protein